MWKPVDAAVPCSVKRFLWAACGRVVVSQTFNSSDCKTSYYVGFNSSKAKDIMWWCFLADLRVPVVLPRHWSSVLFCQQFGHCYKAHNRVTAMYKQKQQQNKSWVAELFLFLCSYWCIINLRNECIEPSATIYGIQNGVHSYMKLFETQDI